MIDHQPYLNNPIDHLYSLFRHITPCILPYTLLVISLVNDLYPLYTLLPQYMGTLHQGNIKGTLVNIPYIEGVKELLQHPRIRPLLGSDLRVHIMV